MSSNVPPFFIGLTAFLLGACGAPSLRETNRISDSNRASATTPAPDHRHDFETDFSNDGLRVGAREAGAKGAALSLELERLGRENAWIDVPAGELSRREGRVELTRSKLGLVEWFVEAGAGLEHGFTIAARPHSASDDPSRSTDEATVVLELAVAGAEARLLGDSIVLSSQAGGSFDYGQLAVVDARGTKLPARFAVPDPKHIRLVVDDAGAVYPIVIDPLLTRTADAVIQRDLAVAGISAVASVDVNGDGYDDLVVGSDGSLFEHSVRIYHGGPNGLLSAGAAQANTTLTASTLTGFGRSVASAGDVNRDGYGDLIVGAPQTDTGQGSGEGAAYLFLGSPTGIASGGVGGASARLEGNQTGSSFGGAVDSAGDINGDGYDDVVVGAFEYDNGQTNEGAAFLFLGSASGIANGSPATASAILESNQASSAFGSSVASAGDVNGDGFSDVIVGASLYDNGQVNEGAAFVFRGSAIGVVSANPTTAATTLEANQTSGGGGNAPSFGSSVDSAGDVNGDGFDDVIVGASSYDKGQIDEGAAFIFLGSPTGVANGSPATAATTIESDQGGDALLSSRFGQVSGAGDVNGDGYADVVVGAGSYDDGASNSGAAFVAFGSATGVQSGVAGATTRVLGFSQIDAFFGTSTGFGDFDADGFSDVTVVAFAYDAGQTDEGAAFVYRGGGAAPGQDPLHANAAALTSLLAVPVYGIGNGYAAVHVNGIGDLNADGYADYAVGIPTTSNGQPVEGVVLIYLGKNNPPGSINTFFESNQTEALLSQASAAGDVNGDGYDDLIVSGSGLSLGESGEGVAYLFLGSANGVSGRTLATADAVLQNDQVLAAVSASGPIAQGAGDVNGDGFDDVVMFAPAYDAGQTNEGAAFLYLGSATGIASGSPATANARLETNQSPSIGTTGLSSAEPIGDVDGDGYDDIALTVPYFDPGSGQREKAAFVFHGSASGIASGSLANAQTRVDTNQSSAKPQLLLNARAVGDVDGDGFDDVVFADDTYTAGESEEGAAFLLLGSPTGIPSGAVPGIPTFQSNFVNGRVLLLGSTATDLNGDGFSDLIVSTNAAPFAVGTYTLPGSSVGIPSRTPANATLAIPNPLVDSWSALGDLNGDGFGDLLWASISPTPDPALFDGLPIVTYGNGAGRPARPRQRRGDGSGVAVSAGGLAHSANSFVVELEARSARTRQRAKLEVEACPLAKPFGHANCTRQLSPTWAPITAAGTLLSQSVTGLLANELYTWRVRAWYAPQSGAQPTTMATADPGPWFRLQSRGGRGDIRTSVPEPGSSALLVAGCSALGAMARRRRRRRHAE